MYINKINIENFKGIERLEICCNEVFNVIIGQNNIGKSTIFEALLLWKKCFDKSIKQKNKGFYRDNTNKYLLVDELNFLRFIEDKDLFNSIENREMTLSVEIIDNNNNKYLLGFKVERITNPQNAYLRIHYLNYDEFNRFYEYIKEKSLKLGESIFLYQTKPVSNVYAYEPIMTKGQITTKINKGKSQEVLRNKMKKNHDLDKLTSKINAVLESEYQINFIKGSADEYIDLKIKSNNKEMDIHLQGSGFLQVAEIFSSIGYFDSALNVLLLDEPDSHIHAKLQKNLIKELKANENTQTFIISHNDSLVDEAQEGEIFLLNDNIKVNGALKPLSIKDFNLIKRELGGTINAIDMLSYSNKTIFVEGEGDIQYIKSIIDKYNEFIELVPEHTVNFFKLRGKGYMKQKIQFYIRLLTQLSSNKKFAVIFDKDFCDINSNQLYIQDLKSTIGRNFEAFSYEGYCIESTLFSDRLLLQKLLSKITNSNINDINMFIEDWFGELKVKYDLINNNSSEDISKLKKKFKSQKSDDRPDLQNVEFSAYLIECIRDINNVKCLMNKDNIKMFIKDFEQRFGKFITADGIPETSEYYSQELFNLYIKNINSKDDIYSSHINLIKGIYELD